MMDASRISDKAMTLRTFPESIRRTIALSKLSFDTCANNACSGNLIVPLEYFSIMNQLGYMV